MRPGWGSRGFVPAGGSTSLRLFPPLTPGIRLLAIVLGVCYLVEILWFNWIGPRLFAESESARALLFHLPLVPAELFQGYLWQPLTSLLLHDPTSPSHLLLNLLMLWLFGAELETGWGVRRFFRVLLLGGLGGAVGVVLLGLLLDELWVTPVLGCSGAVYALLAAYGSLFPERLLWPLPLKARHLVLVVLGLTVLSFLVQDSLSFGAPLGGLACGWLLTGGRRWLQRRRRPPRGANVRYLEDELRRRGSGQGPWLN